MTLGVNISNLASPEPVDALNLAQAVRERLNADVGLAVTPLASEESAEIWACGNDPHRHSYGREEQWRGQDYTLPDGCGIRERAVTHALLELAKSLETGSGGHEARWG